MAVSSDPPVTINPVFLRASPRPTSPPSLPAPLGPLPPTPVAIPVNHPDSSPSASALHVVQKAAPRLRPRKLTKKRPASLRPSGGPDGDAHSQSFPAADRSRAVTEESQQIAVFAEQARQYRMSEEIRILRANLTAERNGRLAAEQRAQLWQTEVQKKEQIRRNLQVELERHKAVVSWLWEKVKQKWLEDELRRRKVATRNRKSHLDM